MTMTIVVIEILVNCMLLKNSTWSTLFDRSIMVLIFYIMSGASSGQFHVGGGENILILNTAFNN